LNHYCSPNNATFFEVNQDIPVSWLPSSPFFTPLTTSTNMSVLILLEDPTTHRSIWNRTVTNAHSATDAVKILVTEDMLDRHEYRLVNLVVQQAQNATRIPPSLYLTLGKLLHQYYHLY
jgi:hypothetical protein